MPLQPIYLSHWFPLLMIAVVLGSLDARPWLRIVGLGLIGGLSLTSVALNPTASQIATSQTPRDMAALCRAVLKSVGDEAVVLHRDDFEAKLLNLGCPISGRQATNAAVVPRGAPAVAIRACDSLSRECVAVTGAPSPSTR